MKRRRNRRQTREVRWEDVSITGEAGSIVARVTAEDARVVSLRLLVCFSTVATVNDKAERVR